uniref:Uncharacterized protein n=1 Tax=Ananas comosus var. bracteatus TaxID=296719 RepID=A0A6V7PUW4_ANACO|nr:unnamed protein product [Ananas comosus var. bracteatus]
MELVRSAVYGVLRIKPPVPLQYRQPWWTSCCGCTTPSGWPRGATLRVPVGGDARPACVRRPRLFMPEQFLGSGEKGYFSICIGPIGRRPSDPLRRTISAPVTPRIILSPGTPTNPPYTKEFPLYT